MTIDIHDPTLATDEELAAQLRELEAPTNMPPFIYQKTFDEDYEQWQIVYEAWMAEEIYRKEPNAENLEYRDMTFAALDQIPEDIPDPEFEEPIPE